MPTYDSNVWSVCLFIRERWVNQKVNVKEMQTVQGSHSFQFSPQTTPVALNSHCVSWASVWQWCCLLSWPSLVLNLVASHLRNPERMTVRSCPKQKSGNRCQSLWRGTCPCLTWVPASSGLLSRTALCLYALEFKEILSGKILKLELWDPMRSSLSSDWALQLMSNSDLL